MASIDSDRRIDFYFDFGSPFAYLANTRLPALAERYGYSIEYVPVDLKEAKLAVGNTGPSTKEMPVKYEYIWQDLRRWAGLYGIPIRHAGGYGSHRINSLAYLAIDRDCARQYVDIVFDLVWGRGGAMNDDALLQDAARTVGWREQEVSTFLKSGSGASRLIAANENAYARGVFGVPAMLVDDQLWWGNDRISFLESYLKEVSR